MSREMRIIWLHDRLSSNDPASMNEYTGKFGISSRQARRDFKYMRTNLGAPLKYSRTTKEYFYSETYRLPSLFEDSMKSQTKSENLVSSIFLKAINRKKAVKVVLRGGNEFFFSPACFDERQEQFCGVQEDGELCFVRSDEVDKVKITSRRYIEEPMLWKKLFPRGAKFSEARFDFQKDFRVYHFFHFGDLVMFLASNEEARITGPEDVVEKLKEVAASLLKTLGA
ncbi:MAG TPA: hypothetical protein DIT26_00285 [Mesotoga infera]|uniref:WYL domain-containing protein n=1 Tax=Mesotoga infera TaxID=1236046 RepID=A0A101I931_9BACT|nr:MAG: Uncharacterized protein XD86_1102 [Mesotoga infera]KUK90764.1 MAG: Uncharacterized protein XE02_0391 [Mesotoga infera]HCO69022.1 hypothetical protein [Mesotoga infera]